MSKPILLDIMVNGSYYCQLRYDKHGFPELIDGKIEEVYDAEELKKYVEERLPSLKTKKYSIAFTNQRV